MDRTNSPTTAASPNRRRGARSVRAAPTLALVAAILLAGCAPARNGTTGGSAQTAADEPAGSGYVEADVRFMRGMIVHHAQALEMTGLVPERTRNEDVRRLARRIEISQVDEIETMERWLESRGEPIPEPHDHGAPMPGMLTAGEMDRLAAAEGTRFDRLFLEGMIRHHEGALVMVEDLFAVEGAGEEAEVFVFASHVDADQRAEIARMRRVLDTISRGGSE